MRTIPASNRSSRLKRKRACRLVAISPGAVLRLRPLATALILLHRALARRHEVDPPAPRVDADKHGSLLVELPPIPAHAANGKHPLVDEPRPEGDERPGADQAHHLAIELLLPARLRSEE